MLTGESEVNKVVKGVSHSTDAEALSLKVTLASSTITDPLWYQPQKHLQEAEICKARQLETVSSQVRDQNGRVEAGVVKGFPQNSQADRDALRDGMTLK